MARALMSRCLWVVLGRRRATWARRRSRFAVAYWAYWLGSLVEIVWMKEKGTRENEGLSSSVESISCWNFGSVMAYDGMLFSALCFDQDLPEGFDPEVGFRAPPGLFEELSDDEDSEEDGSLEWGTLTELIDSMESDPALMYPSYAQ